MNSPLKNASEKSSAQSKNTEEDDLTEQKLLTMEVSYAGKGAERIIDRLTLSWREVMDILGEITVTSKMMNRRD